MGRRTPARPAETAEARAELEGLGWYATLTGLHPQEALMRWTCEHALLAPIRGFAAVEVPGLLGPTAAAVLHRRLLSGSGTAFALRDPAGPLRSWFLTDAQPDGQAREFTGAVLHVEGELLLPSPFDAGPWRMLLQPRTEVWVDPEELQRALTEGRRTLLREGRLI
ncbi:hypothetical protein [Kitasatospora sp. NPDC088134]|uniref:hypothetical protein n=1 Tax=Kitasatospora sp. NPDC088134 TaxID=3364071 RepID=UPI003808C63E